MQIEFGDRVAVVTGASRGIGRAIAAQLARSGAKVALAARREAPLRALESELRDQGLDAIAVVTDVASHDECARLIEAAAGRWGRIDILVNSAGVSGVQKLISDLEPQEFDEVIKTNVYSIYSCIHFAARHMIAQKSGAIVNISSGIGKAPSALRTPYATSKMALVGLTRTVALELGPYKIRCNAVSPGWVEGERGDEVVQRAAKARNLSPDHVRERLIAATALREPVTDQDICDTVLFLCSDRARHITGQDFSVNSGSFMS